MATRYKIVTAREIDIDGTLAANSDAKIASQKAVKTYVDGKGITVASKAEVATGTDNTKAVTPLSIAEIHQAPEGYVFNGKIVPSVSSNNLTLALKGKDGNDPSATNPVYAMLGGSLRTISSALSVTKNAGTNWCNAGSSEFATKEIDYFAYLGYNATNGVVIGFSRYPGANQYSDFSSTTTNEKYCAISTITNAASTDYYNVIGRFAATLSAGAGYTWSVPTFSAINLIQQPIYDSRPITAASGYIHWASGRYLTVVGTKTSSDNTTNPLNSWYQTSATTTTYGMTYSAIPKVMISAESDHAVVGYASISTTSFVFRGRSIVSIAATVNCHFFAIGTW